MNSQSVRTTILLSPDLLEELKILAAKSRTSVSDLLHQGARMLLTQTEQKKKPLSSLSGKLNLGGKEPPTRDELYDYVLKKI